MHMNNPIGNSIQAAGEARQAARARIVSLTRHSRAYDARVAHGEAQEEIRKHRARAVTGARGIVASKGETLFALTRAHGQDDPARVHDLKVRRAAVADRLKTEEEAQTAYDRLLKRADIGGNVELAGGIAAKALSEGWESIVSHWVATPALGSKRGGRAALEAIREARQIIAGTYPAALQDLPSIEDMVKPAARKR